MYEKPVRATVNYDMQFHTHVKGELMKLESQLNEHDQIRLNKVFKLSELRKICKALNKDKATGINSFNKKAEGHMVQLSAG